VLGVQNLVVPYGSENQVRVNEVRPEAEKAPGWTCELLAGSPGFPRALRELPKCLHAHLSQRDDFRGGHSAVENAPPENLIAEFL
jgi:hypothetical protein